MTTLAKRKAEALNITGILPSFTFEKLDKALEEGGKMCWVDYVWSLWGKRSFVVELDKGTSTTTNMWL